MDRIAPLPHEEPQIEPSLVSPTVEPVRSKKLEIPDIVFDFDKYQVKTEAATLLDSLLTIIEDFQPEKIEIIGYTDNVGGEAYNQILSEKRATAIANYFLERHPEFSTILTTAGKGEANPKADNTTPANRGLNRRVEIQLWR